MSRIFLICTVRGATDEQKQQQADYVSELERAGHSVHFPARGDTDQSASGIEICRQNYNAILASDVVHVFYFPCSQGTHFDMGMAFALNKPVVLANHPEVPAGKSFARMLHEWQGSIEE